MRRTHLALPLALVTLLACQPSDDPSASGDPVSPAAPPPSFGAAVLKIPENFFLIFDDARKATRRPSGWCRRRAIWGSGPDCGGSARRCTTEAASSGSLKRRPGRSTFGTIFARPPSCCTRARLPMFASSPPPSRAGARTGEPALDGQGPGGWLDEHPGHVRRDLELTAGGRAQMLGVGHVVFDQFGNVTVHEDHLRVKTYGK